MVQVKMEKHRGEEKFSRKNLHNPNKGPTFALANGNKPGAIVIKAG
jgi:hypothetical protein